MVTAVATVNYNPATKSVQINVVYTFIGFLAPVDNPPTLNVGSAPSAARSGTEPAESGSPPTGWLVRPQP